MLLKKNGFTPGLIILLVFTALALVLMFYFYTVYVKLYIKFTPIPFSSKEWKKAGPQERGFMIDDIIDSLERLHKDKLIELLGKPDEGDKTVSRDQIFVYYLGYRKFNQYSFLATPYSLQVEFLDNIVDLAIIRESYFDEMEKQKQIIFKK